MLLPAWWSTWTSGSLISRRASGHLPDRCPGGDHRVPVPRLRYHDHRKTNGDLVRAVDLRLFPVHA
eukprot:2321747-Pyramimonas_sp.AAC.1